MSYRVIAACAIATDQGGRHRNYYYGSTIPWLSEAQAKHFLSHKLVQEIHEPARHAAPVAPAAVAVENHGKPAKVASKEAWVEHGVALGQNRGELESLTKQDIIDLLG